jgi:hypothetical protein
MALELAPHTVWQQIVLAVVALALPLGMLRVAQNLVVAQAVVVILMIT